MEIGQDGVLPNGVWKKGEELMIVNRCQLFFIRRQSNRHCGVYIIIDTVEGLWQEF